MADEADEASASGAPPKGRAYSATSGSRASTRKADGPVAGGSQGRGGDGHRAGASGSGAPGSRRAPRRAARRDPRRIGLLAALFAAVVGCLTLIVVRVDPVPTEPLEPGTIAVRTIKAPFGFAWQDLDGYEAARRAASDAAPMVFRLDEALPAEVATTVAAAYRRARASLAAEQGEVGEVLDRDALVAGWLQELGAAVPPEEVAALVEAGFPPSAEARLVGLLSTAYAGRLVLADTADLPEDDRPIRVVPEGGTSAPYLLRDRDDVKGPDDLRDAIRIAAVGGSGPVESATLRLALAMVRPNLHPDPVRTEAARAEALDAVALTATTVQRGEIIVREGDKVSAAQALMVEALRSSRGTSSVLLSALIMAAFLGLLLGALAAAWRAMYPDEEAPTGDVVALGAMLVGVGLMGRVVVASAPGVAALIGNDAAAESVWYLVPAAGMAMLARTLLGARKTAFFNVAAASLLTLLMNLDAVYVVYFLATSIVASALAASVKERIGFMSAGLSVGVFAAAFVFLIHFVQLSLGVGDMGIGVQVRPLWSGLFALGGGLLSGFLVLGLVPVFESFGFTTDYRMLELASLNHPLMKQLMLRAPGTYHHSVIVGTLAEAACEAIGANGLQAKIAAYFHDIGKALKPRYFVENQRGGVNRHNELSPEQSAAIIISHVTEGARMAREHKLPQPIIDNILMHHGTGILQYFFAKAKLEASDPSRVDEAVYRYPGPKPNTREAGVIMLSDKVEAATRTIKNPTEANVRAMINRIVNSVMADDQFSDCPMTFREIYTVADTFVTVLMGIYHQRIEYPQTAGISQAAPMPQPDRAALPPAGTITLDLDRPAAAALRAGAPAFDEEDVTDETDDYESLRNLPQGE